MVSVSALVRAATLVAMFAAASGHPAFSKDRFITVSSTTSVRNSGLYDSLLPQFKNKTGIDIRIIAVGTGRLEVTHQVDV